MKFLLNYFLLLLTICLLSVNEGFTQKYAVSGYIIDKSTGETVIGVAVLIKNTNIGTMTDGSGFFLLNGIEKGEHELIISHIAYKQKIINILVENKNLMLTETSIEPAEIKIDEIKIVEAGPDKIGDKEIETSQLSLSPKAISSIPTARNDIFKALKYMPGIEATEPFSPLVSVRGSDPGENLILLDGVTIYNPYHFLSASGIFNMQTIKNVDIMLGGFGAEYGGRNASVIYLTTKDGNNKELHGEIEPTTTESKIFLEFPVGNKGSMMLAARLNYDIISNFLLYSQSYFYDLNLSYTHRINDRNRLTFKLFNSKDNTDIDFNSIYKLIGNSFNMEEVMDDMHINWENKWQNSIATAILKTVISPKLLMRTQVYGSFHRSDNFTAFGYKFKTDDSITIKQSSNSNFLAKINDITSKVNFSYTPATWNNVNFGIEYNNYLFKNETKINKVNNGDAKRSLSNISAYIEDKITLGWVSIRPGLRISQFEKGDYLYEPRINSVIKFPQNYKLKLAWGKYFQNIISMNTQEYEFNQFLDYYYPLDNQKHSISNQYILGCEKAINSDNTISVELYYKDIERTYTFDLLQNMFEAFTFSDKIVAGKGKSMGLEIMYKGAYKKLSGWASYGLSQSKRSFPNIMNGKWHFFDFDRTHSFKTVINYQITERFSYSTSFVVQSGVPKSVETSMQYLFYYDPVNNTTIYNPQFITNYKNNARSPMLLNLHVGIRKEIINGFGRDLADFFNADQSYLTVAITNLLFFRRNVIYYFPIKGYEKYIPLSDSYFPSVSMGYAIKF